MRPPPPAQRAPASGEGRAALALLAVLAAAMLAVWLDVGLAALLARRRWSDVQPGGAPALLVRLLIDHGDVGRALPPVLSRRAAHGAAGYVGAGLLLGGALGATLSAARASWRALQRRMGANIARPRHSPARWGGRADLAPLAVSGPRRGRVVLGRCGRQLVAAEAQHSVLVTGPTQSGKTSGLVIPAILEWEGPVVATSVKGDLLRATLSARRERGDVAVFDPAGVTDVPGSGWSPLADAGTWRGALRAAAALCSVARAAGSGLEDGGFWYTLAEKLLAPLLLAGARSRAGVADLLRWVDTEEVAEVLAALEDAGEHAALQAFAASVGREDRQRGSVYATLESVLAAYADPLVAASAATSEIDPVAFVSSGRSDTCYLLAPAHEQERLQPVFVALLRGFLDAAFTSAARRGGPLDPPLLVVLDEAANVAPVAGLDAVAATAASHGIQLVTVWQDLAQVEARYGNRASTVVNNHRAKVLCSGVTDPTTLERVSTLIGEEERWSEAHSVEAGGGWSRTASAAPRRIAPGDELRRLPPGQAVLVYGHLPPLRLSLRPYHQERSLRRLAESDPA